LSVVIPYYDTVYSKENKFDCVHSGFVQLGNFTFPINVQKVKKYKLEFELYLVVIPELFDKKDVYGCEDNI